MPPPEATLHQMDVVCQLQTKETSLGAMRRNIDQHSVGRCLTCIPADCKPTFPLLPPLQLRDPYNLQSLMIEVMINQ
jgi:hypothetical protein